MKYRIAILATSSLSCILLSAAPVRAQEAADNTDTGGIADIIVTAQKRAQSLSDVGMTVNVVSSQQLARQSVTSVADLTKTLPGLTVATTVSGTPIYTLRGISFNVYYFGAQPTVSVYTDEAPLPFPVMTQGALLDLERVEVLKGPQGTLFGQNSTAGALNYIAAKPTDEFHTGIRASYGRFDTVQGEAYVSGPLSDTLKARLSVGGTTSGPWQKSATRNDELGNQRKLAGRLLLDWRPTDRLKFNFNINGWLDKSDTLAPQTLFHRPSVGAQADPRLYTSPITATSARSADWWPGASNRRNNKFYQLVARADYELSDNATLTSLTDYTHAKINSVNDFSGKALNFGTTTDAGYAKAISEELRLSGDLADDRLHYVIGGSYQFDKSLEDYRLLSTLGSGFRNVAAIPGIFPGFGSFDAVVQHSLQSNKAWAGFGNLDWKATDRLTLSVGARQTHITHYSNGCSLDGGSGQLSAVISNLSSFIRSQAGLPPAPPIPPGGCVTLGPTFTPFQQDDSFGENNFAWRGNVNFKVNADLTLYATVSRGFKGGNYPVPAASSYTQLAPVRQERLTAYEAGVKSRLFDRHLTINAALFYYDYTDKQLQTIYIDPIFGHLLHLENIPKSKVKGFDIDATLVPVEGLTLRTAVTYADSKVGQFSGFDNDGNPVDLTGHAFNFAPKWISVSDAEYQLPVSDAIDVFVGGSYTYNSKTYSDLASSTNFEIRSFGIFDLRAGITSKTAGWEIMAAVHNVGNEYTWNYVTNASDSDLRFPNMPRTYSITLSYKY